MFATTHLDNLVFPHSEKDTGDMKFFIPAMFFLLVQAFVMSEFIRSPKVWQELLWYCNHVSLLYFFAFYFKRPQMVIGIMQVGIVIQLLWLIDFFGHLVGIDFINAADYMFIGEFGYAKIITLLIHVLIPIAVLYWIGGIRPKTNSLVYSLYYIAPLYIFTRWFAPSGENINCVLAPCAPFIPAWNYTTLWPMYVLILSILTHLVVQYSLSRVAQRKEHTKLMFSR